MAAIGHVGRYALTACGCRCASCVEGLHVHHGPNDCQYVDHMTGPIGLMEATG